MEGPVMTSASSHRLRSAVSACAQPTHSYLSSTYLGTSIQCDSNNSGGCFKKFNNFEKDGESLFFDKLKIKKKHLSNDYSSLYKRHKLDCKVSLNHCYGSGNNHKPKNINVNEKDTVNKASNRVLNIIPKQFMLGNDLLSKVKLNENLINSKRLTNCHNKALVNKTVQKKSEKVIRNKLCKNNNNNNNNLNNQNLNNKININNRNDNSNNVSVDVSSGDPESKLLIHRNNCYKGKNKNTKKDTENLYFNSKNNIDDGNGHCGGCQKYNVHLDKNTKSERQDILKWQPKHVVTRRTAQIIREIRHVWQTRVGLSKSAPTENVILLWNDLGLFFNTPQVRKMLECSKKSPETTEVFFKDFYKVTSNFIRTKGFKAHKTSPLSIVPKNVERRIRKFSKGMSKYEVFLGGSCNPTTWRNDVAIPELENMGISYYNPQQVEEWKPELLEVEYHAKENATVMFFVIDNITRGVSALIEVAHLAGCKRELILVIQSYTQKNQIICDEEISETEYEDLKTGQDVLQNLVIRQGIPVFDNIKVALQHTEKIIKENSSVKDLQDLVCVNRKNAISSEEVFEKLSQGNEIQGEVSVSDACLALKMLTGREVSVSDLQNIIKNSENELNGTNIENDKLDYVHFSQLIKEFIMKPEEEVFSDRAAFLRSLQFVRDVYLGGTIENTTWRESIALPLLQSHNLTFFIPKVKDESERFSDIEAAAMENSYILLFVITNTARSIAAMAIAGHYIGKGANVVLCVQHLPEGAVIDGEKLSDSAVKDYNRGRMYLTDIAKRNGVPVFDDILMVVNHVIEKCKSR